MSQAPPKPAAADGGDEEEAESPEPEEEEDEPVEEKAKEAAEDAVAEDLDALDAENVEVPGRDDEDITEDPFDGEEEVDLDLAETDIGEPTDEGGEEDPFDGEESGGSDAWDGAGGGHDFGAAEDGAEKLGDMAADGNVGENINAGAARLAVVGLPEQFEHNGDLKHKEDLEDEFEEVFETFQLGKFGEQAADEYLNVDDDIDPLWGFAASMVICSVMVVQMRPDGDVLLHKMKRTAGGAV